MAKAHEQVIALGVLHASPVQMGQIKQWADSFRRVKATVTALTEIGLERYDLYLVLLDGIASEAGSDEGSGEEAANAVEQKLTELVAAAGLTPCLALAGRDDERLADAALAAGAADFLYLPSLDAAHFERAVHFGLGRRRVVDAVAARESYLAAARERDRLKLANALHDGPLQDLIGARFLLGALAADGSAAEIQESLQSVIQEVRALCSHLKPPALGPFGLEKAIRAHIQTLSSQESGISQESGQSQAPGPEVILELEVDNPQLPEWARLALFRIFQAAVSNVVKHAQASQMWVRLHVDKDQDKAQNKAQNKEQNTEQHKGHLRLTIADDGQGFEVPSSWLEFARTDRFGLLMMQERVDALQGRMVVQSTPGSGTRVMVQVPVNQPPLPLPAFLASTVPDRNG